MLHREDVKKDLDANGLGVTAEQQAQLDDLDRRRREGFPAFLQLARDDRQQRLLDDARAKEDALDKLLTPQQQGRLKQIALQLKPGLSAFHDPDVVEALKLTTAQKESLRAIEADSFFPGPDSRRGSGKGPEPGFRPPTEKVLAVLTEDQKRRWKDMTGEPFKESPRPFGPPPPGRGPGGFEQGPPQPPDPLGKPPGGG